MRKNTKGVTLITLAIAVIILMILSSMILINSKDAIKIRNLKMMQNDIELLDDEIHSYYVKHGAIPAEIEYMGAINFERQPNDNERYLVIDLSALERITLNYGLDYDTIVADPNSSVSKDDVYIINEQSHHIYYARGIELDGEMHYTNSIDEEISLIQDKTRWVLGRESYQFNEIFALNTEGDVYSVEPIEMGSTLKNVTNKMVKISAGGDHTVALNEDGKVYAWGDNSVGQVGIANGAFQYTKPICISDIEGNGLKDAEIVEISAGGGHTVALDKDGKVYTWGYNENGQLGRGTEGEQTIPICISTLPESPLQNITITEISAGGDHTVALDKNGKVYTWGRNEKGQLGNGGTTNEFEPKCISEIGDLKGKTIIKIAAGEKHTIAIDKNGNVYTWGNNEDGQLGNGTEGEQRNKPICINTLAGSPLQGINITEISAGYSHNIAVDGNGKVYVWGHNMFGLGDEELFYSNEPKPISNVAKSSLQGESIAKVSAGYGHSIALDDERKVHVWGDNSNGQLGDGNGGGTAVGFFPTCISEMDGHIFQSSAITITEISAGGGHTVALDEDGNIYTWGDNICGQLGDGTEQDKYEPICLKGTAIVQNKMQGKNIIEISSSGKQVIALDDEGKVYTWGSNEYGQLGNGTEETENEPQCISDIEGSDIKDQTIVKISAGFSHSVALDDKGKVYVWGSNGYGQLGIGSGTTSITVPKCISEIGDLKGKTIVEIAAGYTHTVAVDANGKVYAWGANWSGKLGIGTTTVDYCREPQCISDIEGSDIKNKKIVKIAAGESHTIAMDKYGRIYTWGDNDYGQLGNGTEEEQNIPKCISNETPLQGVTITQISAGRNHNLVVDANGKVYAWGSNEYGQLGTVTPDGELSEPKCISDDEGNVINGKSIVDVFAGRTISIMVDNIGNIYVCGEYVPT